MVRKFSTIQLWQDGAVCSDALCTAEEIRAQLIKAHQWSRAGGKGHHLKDLQSRTPQVGVALIAAGHNELSFGLTLAHQLV